MGKKNYDDMVKHIVDEVGGTENIISLFHCITRLRFRLKDMDKADKAAVEKIPGVMQVVIGNGQFQVVIGSAVADVYDAVRKAFPKIRGEVDGEENATTDREAGKGENPLIRVFGTIAKVFTPCVTALAGAGMLKAILVILTTFHMMDAAGSTYKILSAAGNSVFYFLPLFLAVSAARVFQCNSFISLAIVAALLEPNFTGLMTATGDVVSFLGIPVVLMGYSGSVIPAILSVFIYSRFERILKRVIPKSIELFALPLVGLMVMVPLAVIVIGPVGVTLGNGMGTVVNFLSDKSGLLAGAVIGGGWTFLVMIGIHWGIVPIMVNNIATLGYDTIRPMIAGATFASAGVAFGAFLKFRRKEDKVFAFSNMIPALLGGITEPIVYGLSVQYKRMLVCQVIGGAVGSAFMGMMHTKALVYVFPALTTLPAFFCDTFVYYIIGITVAFVLTAVLVYFFGFTEAELNNQQGNEAQQEKNQTNECILKACVKGTSIPLENVADPVFSSKVMGDGLGFIPKEGTLYAPCSGTVAALFPTGHAVGIQTEEGLEILMHIGINTVELNGEGFQVLAVENSQVTAGQPLVAFDLDWIKEKGYDMTTMLCVSNMDRVETWSVSPCGAVEPSDPVIVIKVKD